MRDKEILRSRLKRVIREHAYRYLLEQEQASADQGDPVSQAQALIKGNAHISNLADSVTKDSLIPVGNEYLLFVHPNTFTHVLRTHAASSDKPGSKLSSGMSSESALIDAIKKIASTKPTAFEQGRYKWYNYDMKNVIGKDSVKKASENEGDDFVDYEKIGNNKALPAIIKSGSTVVGPSAETPTSENEPPTIDADKAKEIADSGSKDLYYIKQNIKTAEGEMPDTNLLNLSLAPIGKSPDDSKVKWSDGKDRILVSLVTMFPGVGAENGQALLSKEAFSKAGYVFIKPKSTKTESLYNRGAILAERWQKLAGLIK